MPRPKTKGCQTDYDTWIEHQIQEGIEKLSSKLKSEFEDQLSKLKSHIENLESSVEHLTRENESLNNLQQASESTIEQLQSQVEGLEERNVLATSRFHKQLEEKDNHIRLMMEKIDQLEQNSKANNIRIAGVKEEDGENIRSKVMNLVKNQMEIHNIEPQDIKDAGRMGKKSQAKTRDVLVKFNNSAIRELVYRKRKLLTSKNDPLYINEDLTQYRSQLFYEARKIRKKGQIFGAWTQHGNVMVKLKQDDSPSVVSNHNHLKTMIQTYANIEVDSDDEPMYQ